ncbi:MAG: DUF1292 domain-containing protein [Syntrophomonas sp.]|uniref:DUF1292 domain-containing protein n=1 Tax=Syntrophomonas sp. TaxID=2053627 RepID=UPI00260C60D0|nr:DUF1292 domain-containing protein [Syntrophomonas sp.]MDD2510599.1 DUF1292 domain-containing protein [Syntrophomonas sp.]MDD3878691.1 DUF1292 domain-containing protein [Syntrophomonas sp.]MDD4626173.1 DUF1292 domain-containing protein [Syntrophomonas sp.]
MTEEFLEEDFPILVLVDEDGIEHLFELLAELEIENDKYRVLVPLDEEEEEELDEEDGEVVILKVIIDEEGNELLSDIDDETEWEMVVEAWQELVDSEEL